MTPLPGIGSPPGPLSGELEAALEAARRAGAVALRHLGSAAFEVKSDHSIVTLADRECEAIIRECLAARTPYPVIGEETASDESVRGLAEIDRAWVVDPIDGTSSFTAGLPTFGISIGLLDRGLPVAGVFYLPRTDELYACDRSGPSYYGSRPTQGALTLETVDERAFFCTPSDSHHLHDVRFPGKVRSLGSTALHVALVARGAAFGALLSPKVWDVAGVTSILRRAGGDLLSLETGAPIDFHAWIADGGAELPMLACAPQAVSVLRGFVRKRR